MMIYKKLQITFIFLMVCMMHISSIQAQDKKLDKANAAYDKFAFIEAAKLYNEQIKKGNNTAEVYTKLGDCYYYNGNYPEAAESYSKMINSSNDIKSEYYFRYAQALNNSQNYKEAESVMKKYYSKSGRKDLSENWNEEKLLAAIKKQSDRYTIKTVDVNSPFSDFGGALYDKNKVIFASARDTGVVIKRKHSWNDKSFLKLYTADVTVDGGLQNPVIIKGAVNTKYHQSSAAVTKDGKRMYFTRNNYFDKKLGADKNGSTYLKIYSADNVNGEWKNVMELPFPVNSDGFSSAHPALSPDDSQLYFASDRNNNFGNSDLYVVSIKKGGLIGNDLVKLGDEINTLGRETYPYVDAAGILYFSSDGHPGLGGLDVYAAVKDDTGLYHVVNLGDGVNTNADDFAYQIQDDTKKGYFSSNRTGNDDIYGFTENKPIDFNFSIKPMVYGVLKDETSGNPIEGAAVEVYNKNNELVNTFYSDKDGRYAALVEPYTDYKLVYKKPGYTQKTLEVLPLKPVEKRENSYSLFNEMEVMVDGKKVIIEPGADLTNTLKLKPIYFDYAGYKIRESSKAELDLVVKVLSERPSISLQINSHTDSRGRDDFNMKLSENRAKATADYIIKHGIDKSRISSQGFGETRLINKCSNGVQCTEAEHELNRRSEFIVIVNNK